MAVLDVTIWSHPGPLTPSVASPPPVLSGRPDRAGRGAHAPRQPPRPKPAKPDWGGGSDRNRSPPTLASLLSLLLRLGQWPRVSLQQRAVAGLGRERDLRSCPSAMDQLPLLKVFKVVTPDAPWELKLTIRSASILGLASRPKFLEVPHSRAPQQPVRDNRHHLRRIPAAKTGQ
jgi:hypothetical protein